MSEIIAVGLDLAKNGFQLHGADTSGRGVLRRKLRRDQVAAHCGDDGADTTAGAASKQRCTACNCWASGLWRGTSTVRLPNSRSA